VQVDGRHSADNMNPTFGGLASNKYKDATGLSSTCLKSFSRAMWGHLESLIALNHRVGTSKNAVFSDVTPCGSCMNLSSGGIIASIIRGEKNQ
jgi:hypothetical protein